MGLFSGSSKPAAAVRRAQEIAARVQGRKEKKQEKLAAKTLAGLLAAQENAPAIEFPDLPAVARLPDAEVTSAEKRRQKRNRGGGSAQKTGLVGRA